MTSEILIDNSLPNVFGISGGRSSGMMLYRHIERYGIRDQDIFSFQNTGKECPETLDFIHEIELRWNVPIVWLEYAGWNEGLKFEIVDYDTANRKGEPFARLLNDRKYPPNVAHLFNIKPLAAAELKRRRQARQQREFDSTLSELATISREHLSWEAAAYAIDRNGLNSRIAQLPEKAQRIAEQFKLCLRARITARAVNATDSLFQQAKINLSEQKVILDKVSRFAGNVENNIRQQRLYSAFAPNLIRKKETAC